MIPQSNIELSKTRDFGEIIGDTFQFVRENLKPLVTCFFVFCGFFMVAGFALQLLQQLKLMNTMNAITVNPNSYDSSPTSAFSRLFGWEYLALIIIELFSATMMMVTVISYMAIYKSKGNQPATVEEVWGYIKYYIFKVFGSSIALGILLLAATACCIIPGIWLYPIISLMFPIMIVENTGLGYAFNQGFRLIKDNWWNIFGALVVSSIITGVMGGIITIPATLLAYGSMFINLKKGTGGASPVLTGIYVFCVEAVRVLYILPMITLVICYFSLNEMKEGTGLMERINQMGNDKPADDLPAEQY